jgi:arylsulfatase A-like enzyme
MTRSRRLGFALLAGGTVFAAWGLVEAAIQLVRVPWWPAVAWRAAQAMGLYALVGAFIVGAWSVTAHRLDPGTFRVRALVVGVVVAAYILAFVHANRAWFPLITSPSSLAFTAVLTALVLWVARRLARPAAVPLRDDEGSRVERGVRLMATGALGIAALALALPPLWTWPARLGAVERSPANAGRPNVLVLVLDTVRADHVSSYGYPRSTTPNLDRVAREGALFEQASSPMPWAPAHVSLLTGLYMSQHGTNAVRREMDDRVTTLGERLRAGGYQTLAVSNNGWFGRWARVDRGFDEFVEIWMGDRLLSKLTLGQIAHAVAGPVLTDENEANAELTNRLIRRWLDHDRDQRKPFFIFINYFEPQFFYEPPEPYRSRFLDPAHRGLVQWRALRGLNRTPPPVRLDATTRAILADLYDGEIACLDAQVGELLDDLRHRGLLDETVVVITSDHGENLGDHELIEHRTNLYETVLHVPLLVRFPAVFAPGTRVSEPVSTVDIVPTVLSLTLGTTPAELAAMLPGRSLAGREIAAAADRPILAEDSTSTELMRRFTPPFEQRYFTRSLKSLRQGRWKFIWASDGGHELYDLSRDAGETTNLASRDPERAREMAARLEAFVGGLQPVAAREPMTGGRS